MSGPKKISITVVVNGQPTVVDASEDAPLGSIIPDALRQTGDAGQPTKNWELRDADGTPLDLDKKLGDFGFPEKTRLFLVSDPKKISITVVVNGQPTVVDASGDAPLGSIIPDALRQTENSGQPAENWELRDADGTLLDLDKKLGDFGFPEKTRLFLNLKAGVGGHGQRN